MKNSNDNIGNRTRDLPACSAVPQPTALPRAPAHGSVHRNNILVYNSNKMHKSQSLFNLTTALHISGATVTHLQEHKTTVTTASGNLAYATHNTLRSVPTLPR